jgi:hypothetical protein
MAEDSGGGGLALLGLLLGVVVLGAMASSGSGESVPALPAPRKRSLSEKFIPIRGKRRIVEATEVIREEGKTYTAKRYEPSFVPAPWTVRAWYDAYRRAHVIDVAAHPALLADGGLSAKVYVGEEHNPNRQAFRSHKQPLWPDDKFENRIVHRVANATEGVFLIEIEAADLALDFYHEPALEKDVIDTTATVVAKHFSGFVELAEVEKIYMYEKGKLAQRTDLTEQMKVILDAHLDRMHDDAVLEILG